MESYIIMTEGYYFISIGLIIPISTLFAGYWADKHRSKEEPSTQNVVVGFVLAMVFMIFYSVYAFFLPAIFVSSVLWTITSARSLPDIVKAVTVAQVATLFSVGANFADVASVYGKVSFRRHMRQYCVAVLPIYFTTMGVANILAQVLIQVDKYGVLHYEQVPRHFDLPQLAPQPLINILVCVSLILCEGVVSYFLRKRGEER